MSTIVTGGRKIYDTIKGFPFKTVIIGGPIVIGYVVGAFAMFGWKAAIVLIAATMFITATFVLVICFAVGIKEEKKLANNLNDEGDRLARKKQDEWFAKRNFKGPK